MIRSKEEWLRLFQQDGLSNEFIAASIFDGLEHYDGGGRFFIQDVIQLVNALEAFRMMGKAGE